MASRPWRATVALAAAGLLVLAACGSDDGGTATPDTSATTAAPGGSTTSAGPATTAAPKPPGWAGELKVGGVETRGLDAIQVASESGNDYDRVAAIFDTLVRYKADGSSYVPQLAQDLKTTDGITWVLTLRPGVTFTDGTPLDAAAVVFNFDRQRDPASAFAGAGTWAGLDSYSATGPMEVTIKLKAPNGTFWQGLASYNGFIGSPTAIKADPQAFTTKPVAAGPYVVKEYVRDSYTLLERNPGYWDKTSPAYQTVRVQMYPDPIAKAQALKTHELDLSYAGGQATLNAIGTQPEKDGLKVVAANGGTHLLFNFSRGITQDIRVREAMVLAFDPKRTNAAVRNGQWKSEKLECPPFNPGDLGCVEGVWPQGDPAKAKQIVAAYKASGGSVDISMMYTASQQADVEYIQQTLNDVGFNVSLESVAPADWLPRVNSGDFDLTWFAIGYPAAPRMVTLLTTTARNLPKHNIKAYDAAVTKARTSLSEADQRAGWEEVAHIVADNFLVGFWAPFLDGYVLSEDVDLGDQPVGLRILYSMVTPAS